MLECPHCHQPAMSSMRKSCLGSTMSVPCAHCGEPVSVAWLAMGAVVPLIVSIRLALYFGYAWQAALALLVGVCAMVAAHAWLVPLVPRRTRPVIHLAVWMRSALLRIRPDC